MKNESNIQRLSCFLILLTTLLINQVSSDYISDSLLSYSISTEALACERIENNTLIVAKISPDSGYFKLISNENFDFKGEPSNGSGGGTEEKSRRLQINTISSNSFKLITAYHVLNLSFVKPLFGSLLYNGNCPPSNTGLILPPERAFCPFWPLPDVFPRPDPDPRPTRFLA